MRELRCLVLCAMLAACGGSSEPAAPQPTNHAPAAGGHVHHAPRGGLLVVLAEETAHAELILDRARGGLDLYLLGPHAHSPLRSAQQKLWITLDGADGELKLALVAEGNALSGEAPGNTSHFSVTDDRLKSIGALAGRLGTVEVLGRRFEGASFD